MLAAEDANALICAHDFFYSGKNIKICFFQQNWICFPAWCLKNKMNITTIQKYDFYMSIYV